MKFKSIKYLLTLFLITMVTMPCSYASGGDMETSAMINELPPLVNQVYLMDESFLPISTIDVNRQYYLSVYVLEKNGISDITSVSATLHYAKDGTYCPISASIRERYDLEWVNQVSSQSWNSYPAGYLYTDSCDVIEDTPYVSIITFAFRLDKIAMPSGAINTWSIEINVEDRSTLTATYDTIYFDVNDYVEMSGLPSTIDLSSTNMDPEESWMLSAPIPVNASITSNTDVTISFIAQDLLLEDVSIDVTSIFSIMATNIGINGTINGQFIQKNPVPESMTSLYTDVYAEMCELDASVEGYSNSCTSLLLVEIDILDGACVPNVPAGTYVGTWAFSVERGEGTTL